MIRESKRELLRATIFHTPTNPFHDEGPGLATFEDGALVVGDGRVLACGDYGQVRRDHASVKVSDLRGGFLLPGFIDAHIHYPQVRIVGALGRSLLDWLDEVALPEEARMADVVYAQLIASEFVSRLAANGTTTALVFGAHFPAATSMLFEAADERGLRVASGLVLSDRMLLPVLQQSPNDAYREANALIRRYHRHGKLLYAVTPRFALSTSEAMLEVCQTLLAENPDVLFQSHINENAAEVAELRGLFPWAEDYLGVYERFALVGRRSVLAHNVHATDRELERLAGAGAAVAHCPSSNAALGSGIFPMRRHLVHDVRCALGTDVGGGLGFGLLKEALQAYLMQRLAPDGFSLSPGHLLYLMTGAGARALGLGEHAGDFSAGKSADFVYVRPPEGSLLESVVRHSTSSEQALTAIFALAGEESIREVRVEGKVVYMHHEPQPSQ